MTDGLSKRPVISISEADQLREARNIIRQESLALQTLSESLSDSFCDATRMVRACRGSVVVTGVGKAGLIGQKIVATFSSLGTRSHFMHPTEALHGDLGCIAVGDVLLALSNSGESEEVLRLLPSLRRMHIPVIALTRDVDNPLARHSDVVLCIGRHPEAGSLGLAPSCSTTAMLAMGDALALVVSQLRGFTARDFAMFHPAGNLGRQLKPVREIMRTGPQVRVALETETVRQVMINHSKPGRRTGAVILTAEDGRLTGLFTDSDLARLFEHRRDEQLDQQIRHVMTVNPITIGPDVLLPQAIHLMSERKLSEIPVIDARRNPVGMLDITDVLQVVDPANLEAENRSSSANFRHAG